RDRRRRRLHARVDAAGGGSRRLKMRKRAPTSRKRSGGSPKRGSARRNGEILAETGAELARTSRDTLRRRWRRFDVVQLDETRRELPKTGREPLETRESCGNWRDPARKRARAAA